METIMRNLSFLFRGFVFLVPQVFLLLLALMLFNCASAKHMLKSDENPTHIAPSDKALLFFIRVGCNGGTALFINFVDKKFIGETACNTYFSSIIELGKHKVKTIDQACSELFTYYEEEIDFLAGKTYYILQKVTGYGDDGFSGITASVIQDAAGGPAHMVAQLIMEKEIADEYIKKCKHLIRNTKKNEPSIFSFCK
jgi:hypothetical protein